MFEMIITLTLYLGEAFLASYLVKIGLNSHNRRNKYLILIIAIMIPSIIAAFRGGTGTDSAMYRKAYELGESTVHTGNEFEVGFIWLMNILRRINAPYQALFFVMNFFTNLFIILTISKEKNNINIYICTLHYMLTAYMYSFNGMRQYLAVAMGIYAFSMFLNNKKVLSLIIICLASLIHFSALVCFVIIGGRLVFDNRRSTALMIAVFVLTVYMVGHRQFLSDMVMALTNNSYYAKYFTNDVYTDGTILGYLMKAFPMLLVATLNFKNFKHYKNMKIYFGLMVCGYIIGALGSITLTYIDRIGEYFLDLNILVSAFCCNHNIPISNGKSISQKTVSTVMVMYFITMFIYNYFYRGFSRMVPYQGLFPE